MKKQIIGFFLLQVVSLSLTFAAAPPPSNDEVIVNEAVLERIRVEEDITPETTELLGERIDLNSGSLTFQHTDFVFPGPAGLDIVISRSWRGGRRPIKLGSMADWEFEIPRIQTTVVKSSHENYYSGSWGQGEQCSGEIMPWPFTVGSLVKTVVEPHEYYNGVNLVVPGKRVEKLLLTQKAPDSWRYVTQSNWRLTCIDVPDGNEGFKAQSPDGTIYIFDKLVYRQGDVIKPGIKVVPKYFAYLYASRIEDRFGNYINFDYEGDRLQSIDASDGRSVAVSYSADGVVEGISSVLGTWTYRYSDGSSGRKYLSSVILPDNSNWSFNLDPINIWGTTLTNGVNTCEPRENFTREGTIEHPYGIKGTFIVKPVLNGRTGLPMTNWGYWRNKHCYLTAALSAKRLDHPDGSRISWSYTYTENKGAFESDPSEAEQPALPNIRTDYAATDIKGTTVISPDGSKTIHQFYRRWDRLDGQELRREHYDTNGTTLLSRTDNYYADGACLGREGLLYENSNSIICRTITTKTVITEFGGDGIATTYTTEYKDFNSYDTPTLVEEYNSINSAWRRYTRLGYEQHDAVSAEYLLVNVPTTVEYSSDNTNWTTVYQNTYHPANGQYPYLPNEQRRFGAWRQRVPEYHASGEVRRIEYNAPATPAGTTWIEMEDYFRGLPQTFKIPHPEIAGQALVSSQSVNEDGTVSSSRDFKNVLTGYQYDEMRRLSYRDNPAGWNDIELEFLPVVSGDLALGLHTGQYKRVIEKSNHVRTLYFDGLLRPVLESKKDTSTNKIYYRNRSYDAHGNLIFESHWSTSPVESEGVFRTYDGLNRLKTVTRTGDGGTSLTTYLSGNRTRVEDPRGNETTTSFLAYGSPTRDMPVKIEAPENVTTTLSYNLFDRLVSVTQGGITQTHYYDGRQRLCRMNRPETGSSVYAYDDGGQLSWEARGQNLSGSGCLHSSVGGAAKVIYGYNHQAQISFINYLDATPDLSYSYDNNGRLHTLESAAGPQWTYNHNELGLLDDETLEIDGQVFFVDYTYDGNGSLLNIRYPTGKVVTYNPNAFGQPTRAGGYATNVVYYPNGAVDSFTYGNGLSYNTDLNDIQLPYLRQVTKNSSDLFSQTIHYDLVLNIDEIVDNVDSYYSLSMTYDGLDRLDTATGSLGGW